MLGSTLIVDGKTGGLTDRKQDSYIAPCCMFQHCALNYGHFLYVSIQFMSHFIFPVFPAKQ